MKNDTPKSKRGQRLLHEHPELLAELLREQIKTNDALRQQIDQQTRLIEQQSKLLGDLQHEVARLREQLEEARRAGHRQAAPFRIEERQRKTQPGRSTASRPSNNSSKSCRRSGPRSTAC